MILFGTGSVMLMCSILLPTPEMMITCGVWGAALIVYDGLMAVCDKLGR